MGSSNGFSLKWDAYESNAAGTFADLRFDSILSDITLVCDGENFRAHRIILSRCSLVFRQLFLSTKLTHPLGNPLVMLWDITADILASLLDFMYLGEVSVTNDRFNDFMTAAERLQIRGLTQNEDKRSSPDYQPSSKKVRVETPVVNQEKSVLPDDVKDEPGDLVAMDQVVDGKNDSNDESPLTAQNEEYIRAMRYVATEPPTIGPDGTKGKLLFSHFTYPTSRAVLLICPHVSEYRCIFCDKKYLRRSRVRRHISDTHITGFFPCSECGKVFASNRKMKDHQSKSKCRSGLDTSETFPELRDHPNSPDIPLESLDTSMTTDVIVQQILNEQN